MESENQQEQMEEKEDAAKDIPKEVEEEISPEEEQKLPFPNATIVRIMKGYLDRDKMIKKEVKIAMNRWLGEICAKVSRDMNRFPYVMLHMHEFDQATRFYRNMEEFDKEKERILAHLEAIKKDIEKLERDLGKKEEILVKF
ncbi:MAG: hypothetical protein HYX24_00410 [Candidatus Aenigmarchaeota archaeon]|nr:hypothetical protein [Candidatus Aenigmarchaeota archaeon]